MTDLKNIKVFAKNVVNLTRINKPVGIWLLFLPCLFGIFLAYKVENEVNYKYFIWIFFLGSILMRSAGCIINDIIDKKFDKKVKRTKNRPLANNEINLYQALIILFILLVGGLYILIKLNKIAIFIGIIAFFLILLYPLTKRITYYPQIFLGITFNLGILISYSTITNYINLKIILFYIALIVWTIIYDTIYAYQDYKDDKKAKIKSMAVRIGQKPQKVLYFLTSLQIILLFIAGYIGNFNKLYYLFIYFVMLHILCQIKSCDFAKPEICYEKFKSNIAAGVIMILAILVS